MAGLRTRYKPGANQQTTFSWFAGFLFYGGFMKKERKTEFIRLRATKTEVSAVKAAAKLRGVTMSKLIRLAVAEFVKEVKHGQTN